MTAINTIVDFYVYVKWNHQRVIKALYRQKTRANLISENKFENLIWYSFFRPKCEFLLLLIRNPDRLHLHIFFKRVQWAWKYSLVYNIFSVEETNHQIRKYPNDLMLIIYLISEPMSPLKYSPFFILAIPIRIFFAMTRKTLVSQIYKIFFSILLLNNSRTNILMCISVL